MTPSEGELFKQILGSAWARLHPDIQRRFDKNPAPGKPLLYFGRLNELRASRFGKLLGYLTRPLIQGALKPYDAQDVPVDAANQFDIRIEIHHPWFGLAFVQAGVFHERTGET